MNDYPEMYPELENRTLDEAIEGKKPVRPIFTTGYQCMAVIEDYDCNVIRCRVQKKDHGEITEQKWTVYRNGLSTIVQE